MTESGQRDDRREPTGAKIPRPHTPDEAYSIGWDEGQDAIWNEAVCSACGRNHDRDESAMCGGGEVIAFREWVEASRG